MDQSECLCVWTKAYVWVNVNTLAVTNLKTEYYDGSQIKEYCKQKYQCTATENKDPKTPISV